MTTSTKGHPTKQCKKIYRENLIKYQLLTCLNISQYRRLLGAFDRLEIHTHQVNVGKYRFYISYICYVRAVGTMLEDAIKTVVPPVRRLINYPPHDYM